MYLIIARMRPDVMERNGSINDDAFLAMIISSEFSIIPRELDAFGETKEALSRQYFGYGCQGKCDSLEEQLKWADNFAGFWDGDPLSTFDNYLTDGRDMRSNGTSA